MIRLAQLLTVLVAIPFLHPSLAARDDRSGAHHGWRADHHMHLGSPDLCERVGDCLPGNDPPAVLAGDAVRALDEAQVSRGVVFSSAYLYGLADLQLSAEEIARLARLENEFTAAEVAGAGSRLVGFLSVDPLQPSAPEEIRYWRGSRMLVGLKLHFAAAGVDMGLEDHREQVAGAMRAASGQGMPIVVHVGGLAFDAADAETFIESILPAAGDSWVQVAHAGDGYPFVADRHVRVLETFAEHLAADDSRTRRVLFDLSYVPAPEESAETVAALTRAIRRIGLERFLFGSDFNVLTPEQQIDFLARLRLTPEEYALLRANCAPWVCGAHEQDVAPATGGLDVRVLTFNIRYGTAPDGPDGPDAWPNRDRLVYEVIRREDSDFVGLQEALRFQVDAILEAVPGYGLVGVGRASGGQAGEYSAILYRTGRWTVADSGTFWLSDRPEVPGSKGWGNEITRIATWARFVEASSGRGVWLYNTHFDHVSQPSRIRSAELLASRIAARTPPDPVIVTGDFNAGEDNPAILYLKGGAGRSPVRLADTFRVLHPYAREVGTFNEFEGRRDGAKTDYVFAEPETRVRQAEIIRDHRGGRYPSDHYPVSARLTLPDP